MVLHYNGKTCVHHIDLSLFLFCENNICYKINKFDTVSAILIVHSLIDYALHFLAYQQYSFVSNDQRYYFLFRFRFSLVTDIVFVS
jgi:hypothetical protein